MQAPHALRPDADLLAPLRALRRLFVPRILGLEHLIVGKDLESTPVGWRCCGPNPHFLLSHSFSPGWVRIHLKMTATAPGWLELHADPSATSYLKRVEVHGSVDLDCFVYISHPASGLRLSPPAGPGGFRMERLRIEPLSAPRALWHAVFAKLKLARKYWRTGDVLGRGLSLLARGDLAGLGRKLFRGLNGPDLEGADPYDPDQAYDAWRESRRLTDADRDRLRAEAEILSDPPLFSILLLLNGDPADLRRSLNSVLQQTYPKWELCVARGPSVDADVRAVLAERARREPRIRIVEGSESAGRDVSLPLALASGDYVTLLDAGDALAEQTLSEFARTIVRNRGLDMLYADEDRVTPESRHVEPYFKPGWSPETLLSRMYTGRPGVYRTALVRRLGGFRADLKQAQEYDLVMRIAAESPRVERVPDVLYHRHAPVVSVVRAEEGIARGHAVRGEPTVSIIIPSACKHVRIRDEKTFYLLKCLESIQKSTWRRYEIIALHGPAVPPKLAARLDQVGAVRANYAAPFNWARAMNQGAALARGEHLLFLNDDVEVAAPDWLERMLEFSQRPAIGAVGATLFFPNGRLQHAGVAVLGGRPMHPFYSHRGDHPGHFNSLLAPRNCSAVTGACLMTRAEVFRSAGGFDEGFPLNYNDVDYCLRIISGGRRVVCTPHARLYHHELGTRPAEVRPEERDAFLRRWGAIWAEDPYYNPNLSTEHFDYRIRSVKSQRVGGRNPA